MYVTFNYLIRPEKYIQLNLKQDESLKRFLVKSIKIFTSMCISNQRKVFISPATYVPVAYYVYYVKGHWQYIFFLSSMKELLELYNNFLYSFFISLCLRDIYSENIA